MFKKIFCCLVLLLIMTFSASAETTVPGGNVSGRWDLAGSPYLIEGDIIIPVGETLTIEPGVVVKFQSWYKLTVNGYLEAVGTNSDRILFTSNEPGPGEPGWVGIDFIDAPDYSHLEYVTIENGKATAGEPNDRGGALYIVNSSPIIKNATIRNNEVSKYGGAIYMEMSNARIENSTITDNSAGSGTRVAGGAIYCKGSNPSIVNNTIKNNSASANGSFVAAHGRGGAIYLMMSDAIIEYNLISGNELYVQGNIGGDAKGGAIYSGSSDPRLVGNTITENSVSGYGQTSEGGGIYLYQSYPTLVNNILWNDSPEEIYFASDGNPNSIMVAYSDVQGGQSGIVTNSNGTVYWQEGNINSDPLFVDPGSGDYTLQETSPAIDAGTAYYEWQGEVLVDLSSDEYNGSAPDMGAYEHEGTGGPNESPVAVASADPDHGSAPLTVQFNSDESYDPDGTIESYFWDFDDGNTSSEPNPTHTYNDTGTYIATLTVTDDDGATDVDDVTITVQDGTTIWGGEVYGTWTVDGSPYRIEDDVFVPTGETLTIEPGVTVLFMGWYKFTINGTLLAEGTSNDQITFTPDDNDGGWIGLRFVNASSSSHVAHCLIEYGRATGAEPMDRGGGIYIENSDPLIEYSTIENCRATEAGGGIYLTQSNATIKYCTINSNSDAQYGAGIYSVDSTPQIIGNTISNNSASHSGSFSAGKTAGGGIYLDNSDATIEYNVISHNSLSSSGNVGTYSRGGALYISGSDPSLVGNTFSDNSASSSTGDEEGGAIYLYQSDPTVVNSILWNNYPQEVFFSDDGTMQYQSIMFAYSDVEGGQSGIVTNDLGTVYWEEGNINSDPLFVDASNNDYNLQEGSPAIDAGTAYFEWDGDVLVNLSSDEYNGSAPDMGALESNYSGSENESPVAEASADPTSGNAPLTVNFSSDGSSDPDGSITSYHWDFGDGASSDEANPTHTYDNAGNYDAVLTVTDDDGATDQDTVAITVTEPDNQPPVAEASANPTSGDAPLTVNFSSDGSSDPDGSITSYHWDFGDGASSDEANPTHTYDNVGNYDAVLTVTDNDGATDQDIVAITVNEAAQNEMHVEDQNVYREQIWGNIYRGVDEVLIYDQNNQPVSDATVTATYSGPNQGEATGTTNKDGLAILKTDYVWRPEGNWCFEVTDVSKDGYVYNADGNVVTEQCEDVSASAAFSNSATTDKIIAAYPNPFNPETSITFYLDTEQEIVLKIYNILGAEVRTLINKTIYASGVYEYRWDGRNNSGVKVPSGTYFIRLIKGKRHHIHKVILMK